VLRQAAGRLAERVDRRVRWDRLPLPLGLLVLLGLRERLRQRNLYAVPGAADRGDTAVPPGVRRARTLDGRWNDLERPDVGAVGTPFGRNTVPMPEADDERGRPSATRVSQELFTRDRFLPAASLNLLAAAWLQFEVHDWVAHRQSPDEPAPYAADGDGSRMAPTPLPKAPGRSPGTATFLSDQTHWWDASQLYGAQDGFAGAIREGPDSGRLLVGDRLLEVLDRHLTPTVPDEGPPITAPVPNLWVGLALFHVLFAREHNAIHDALAEERPDWGADRLFDTARLVNTAVMAKIHTVEWTPAVIAHPTTATAIRTTWWGLLGEQGTRRWGRHGRSELWTGIPGSGTDDDGIDYALTEEFVSVYRMHPLIPDAITFRRPSDGAPLTDFGDRGTAEFSELAFSRGNDVRPGRRLAEIGCANTAYSLAVANPGAITLHNYPAFLQELPMGDGRILDLGEVDIFRTRECGVGRYNSFRRLFRLPPALTFSDLTDDPAWARQIRDVYDADIEAVDLLVGLFAERPPKGFAFSDTAFRVFLLMAARRLRSDRFFTVDYTPQRYTEAGLRWIDEATLAGILHRHLPELDRALEGVSDVFAPWRPV
jgi:hypothetical protein